MYFWHLRCCCCLVLLLSLKVTFKISPQHFCDNKKGPFINGQSVLSESRISLCEHLKFIFNKILIKFFYYRVIHAIFMTTTDLHMYLPMFQNFYTLTFLLLVNVRIENVGMMVNICKYVRLGKEIWIKF